MARSIGIRVYMVKVTEKGKSALTPFNDTTLKLSPPQMITEFIQAHAKPISSKELERSWYLEEITKGAKPGNSKGYVHYGTFGFESNLKNNRTKALNYRRKKDDVEEIPLFYEFWCPPGSPYGFAVFQSFQGRSCVSIVMSDLQADFEKKNKNHRLRFMKMIPNDARGSLYDGNAVKGIRLIKRNAGVDIADRYFGEDAPEHVDLEISLKARRKKSLGDFGKVAKSIRKNAAGVIIHDGLKFDEAVADVRIGKKIRPVGIFGDNSKAGVIDITGDIVDGDSGHPTFASVAIQSEAILKDFKKMVSKG